MHMFVDIIKKTHLITVDVKCYMKYNYTGCPGGECSRLRENVP